MQRIYLLTSAIVLSTVSACDLATDSSKDFSLPEGNADAGQSAFVSLECTACHSVRGLDLPAPQAEGPVKVVLGGRVSRVKSYGELVTSIINPSHRLARRYRADEVSQEGQSLMTVYNDVMTVTQLIDLVAFLQAQYDEIERPGYRYPVYSYGQGETN